MKAILRLILRNSRLIVLIAALSTIPTAYYTARLYGNLKPDLEELLPRQSRSILDLGEIRDRLQSVQRLDILMYSDNIEASRRFVLDLANKLEQVPLTEIASVEYRIDREVKYFSDRKALFLESKDLSAVKNYIASRIDYEKSLYNPLNIFSGVEVKEPYLDFEGMRRKYETRATAFERYPGGFYATPDQKKRLLMASLPAERSGIEGIRRFKKIIDDTIIGLNPQSYSPDLVVRYAGGVQDIIEEHTALVDDIESSAQIVFTVVLAALLLFFRSFLATAILLTSLFVARFWTFAASWFAIGYLNANSAFMGSIVLGSGITFGVMLLSRYLEERRFGRFPLRAAHIAIRGTARATWTAALAAGSAYGSLYFTEFEGFKQYGIMGFLGMVFCWISSILILPALLLEVERWLPIIKRGKGIVTRPSWVFGPFTRLMGRFPGVFLLLSIGATAFSIWHLTLFDSEEMLEKNLSNLRNKTSMTSGSGFYGYDTAEVLGGGGSPVVVLAHSQSEAIEIVRRLRTKKEKEGKDSLIASVDDLQNFIPSEQAQKVRLLREIDHILPIHYRKKLSPDDRAKIEELLNPRAFTLISEATLPPLVRGKFTERDGSIGRLVVVEARGDSGTWSGAQLNEFVDSIRQIADEVEQKKVPVAGSLTVSSDMIASIVRDGPKASALAFLSVVFLIIILFRRVRIASLMLSALVLGNLWLFGVAIAFGIKINFLNFIALPITFGIGVDYAVNIFDRYLHDPHRDILKVVRETGGAVGLCSFTTIVGYGSLLLAQNQAFVSFGALAVLGEITSMLAAVVALPSLILYMRKFRKRSA